MFQATTVPSIQTNGRAKVLAPLAAQQWCICPLLCTTGTQAPRDGARLEAHPCGGGSRALLAMAPASAWRDDAQRMTLEDAETVLGDLCNFPSKINELSSAPGRSAQARIMRLTCGKSLSYDQGDSPLIGLSCGGIESRPDGCPALGVLAA